MLTLRELFWLIGGEFDKDNSLVLRFPDENNETCIFIIKEKDVQTDDRCHTD